MMHTTSHKKLIYPFETLWTSLAALFKLKQEKEEKLSDYYDKMKAFSVQVKKYLPDDALHKFVEGLDVYKAACLKLYGQALRHCSSLNKKRKKKG